MVYLIWSYLIYHISTKLRGRAGFTKDSIESSDIDFEKIFVIGTTRPVPLERLVRLCRMQQKLDLNSIEWKHDAPLVGANEYSSI
jgi:hypothetical protein